MINISNNVEWTAANPLKLYGNTWTVDDQYDCEQEAIFINDIPIKPGPELGWENKYLSQIGSITSVQKNLQTIYDALGNTVQYNVYFDNNPSYGFNVGQLSDSIYNRLSNMISSLVQSNSRSGMNRISK